MSLKMSNNLNASQSRGDCEKPLGRYCIKFKWQCATKYFTISRTLVLQNTPSLPFRV